MSADLKSWIRVVEIVSSRSWIYAVEIVNSRTWNREFIKLKSWIRETRSWNCEFKKLKWWKSWIHEVQIVNSWSWNREFPMLKAWIHEVKIVNSRCNVWNGLSCLSDYFSLMVVSNEYQILTHDVSCFQFHTIITYV
jgi:hypothetical protein